MDCGACPPVWGNGGASGEPDAIPQDPQPLGHGEDALGKKAAVEFMPMQAGDVQQTHADVTALHQAVGFQPGTRLQDGLERFVTWYRAYHGC